LRFNDITEINVAQNRKAAPATGLKKFYWVLGLLAIVGVAAIAWVVVNGRTGAAAMEPVAVEGAQDPQALVAKAQGVAVGPENAPVKMLVFSDFQCPYCGTFALQVAPVLKNEFVTNGKLQIVYYDFPLGGSHRFSFLASRAARCAGEQNRFWEYHDMLFARQADWAFEESPPVGKLLEIGKEVGLTGKEFEKCVKSDKYQDVVSANRTLGERLQVNATPTLFMNGRKVPSEVGLDVKALRDLINSSAGTP
jgi:protein-disulfide isomerase